MFRSNFWRHFDFWLLGAVIIALVFGVTMIRSAIAGNENLAGLVPRQIIFGGIGFVVIILAAAIDYRFWSGAIVPMYAVIVVFLLLLFVVGGTRFGATRWIETGLVSIQPTELAKIVVILALANFFDRNIESHRNWGWLLKSLVIALGIAGLIFIQPNLSNVIVIMVLWAAMAWVAGLELKQLGSCSWWSLSWGRSPFLSSCSLTSVTASPLSFSHPPMPVMAPPIMCSRPWPRSAQAAGWARAMDMARRPNCVL